jgi:hypothetical protein
MTHGQHRLNDRTPYNVLASISSIGAMELCQVLGTSTIKRKGRKKI